MSKYNPFYYRQLSPDPPKGATTGNTTNTTTQVTNPAAPTATDTTAPANPLMTAIDNVYSIQFTGGKELSLKDALGLDKGPNENTKVNIRGGQSSIILNSDRLILNAKADHLLLCGQDAVTITSPNSVHVDATQDVYVFSEKGEIYLGLPNRGEKKPAQTDALRQKWEPSKKFDFEPVILGLKLINWLEDFLVIFQNLIVKGNQGDSRMSPENATNLEFLRQRLPEVLSTVAFVDGFSNSETLGKPDTYRILDLYRQNSLAAGQTVDPTTFINELSSVGYDKKMLEAMTQAGAVSASVFIPSETITPTNNNSDPAIKDKKVGEKSDGGDQG